MKSPRCATYDILNLGCQLDGLMKSWLPWACGGVKLELDVLVPYHSTLKAIRVLRAY